MDEMKMNLSSKLMTGMISKIITKAIKKKLGCEVEVSINKLSINMSDGKLYLHTDVDAQTSNADVINLIKDSIA